MPTYNYKCDECGQEQEREFPMSDIKQRVKCECGKMARKMIACPAAICRYSLFERNAGNPRANRGKGRR
jgi:putative FmdB family regulatory protein